MTRSSKIDTNVQPILVTGFEPFDGRTYNSSWLLAKALSDLSADIRSICIPVEWGAPANLIPSHVDKSVKGVLALGEGRDGWLDIETIAVNRRIQRTDNRSAMPTSTTTINGAPDQFNSSFNYKVFQRELLLAGLPARRSKDAGGFLCEEMLFNLEYFRTRSLTGVAVVFLHLPPFGSNARISEVNQNVNHGLIHDLAPLVLNAFNLAMD